jgi:hypothetical protein
MHADATALALVEGPAAPPDLITRAKTVRVTTDTELSTADELRGALKDLEREILDHYDPLAQKAHEAHRAITKARAEKVTPVQDALKALDSAILSYQAEQERKRLEEEKRLQELARQKAEDEQLAAAAEIELEEGTEAAEAYLEAPTPAPVVHLAPATPKLSSATVRQNWKFRVVDPKRVPRQYLKVDEEAIGKVVRALKDRTVIPGVEVYPENALAAARR